MGITLNNFMNRFNEFKILPAGESFTISVTDREATAAAQEYLTENKGQVRQMIQKRAGVKLDVDNPSIRFRNDEIAVTAAGGMGFMKVKASLTAEVRWTDELKVTVRQVEVPILSISPEKLNSVVEEPLKKVMRKVEEYAEIRSFKLTDGLATLEAVRK